MEKSYTDGFFNISAEHGFLPVREPDHGVPGDRYKYLQQIVDALPVHDAKGPLLSLVPTTGDNSSGLLSAPGAIEAAVDGLPNYVETVKKETDPFVLQALFRAYCFLGSGYLLCPAHHGRDLTTGSYGRAHRRLPPQIAEPWIAVAEALDVYPFLEYHYAYSLGNYRRLNPANPSLHWNNLGMSCSFSGTSDEIGFIMNHVYINEISPALVEGVMESINANSMENNETAFVTVAQLGLERILDTFSQMNVRRQTMWKASNPKNYNDFRTFIMGITGNDSIFGDGVVYVDGEAPRQYRGQTGAQDDIIPTMDIFSGVVERYPNNMLTKYLLDLRTYRPQCVQKFFSDLRTNAPAFLDRVRNHRVLVLLLVRIVEQIYFFRNGHWQFVQKYIMANTRHAAATGGTPITSWIPNQIEAVLKYQSDLFEVLGEVKDTDRRDEKEYERILVAYVERVQLLNNQLDELKKVDYNVQRVFELNKEVDLTLRFCSIVESREIQTSKSNERSRSRHNSQKTR